MPVGLVPNSTSSPMDSLWKIAHSEGGESYLTRLAALVDRMLKENSETSRNEKMEIELANREITHLTQSHASLIGQEGSWGAKVAILGMSATFLVLGLKLDPTIGQSFIHNAQEIGNKWGGSGFQQQIVVAVMRKDLKMNALQALNSKHQANAGTNRETKEPLQALLEAAKTAARSG